MQMAVAMGYESRAGHCCSLPAVIQDGLWPPIRRALKSSRKLLACLRLITLPIIPLLQTKSFITP